MLDKVKNLCRDDDSLFRIAAAAFQKEQTEI